MTTVNKNIKIPYHLGIIIDGNRRWAKQHNLKPWQGHTQGFKKVKLLLEWLLLY